MIQRLEAYLRTNTRWRAYWWFVLVGITATTIRDPIVENVAWDAVRLLAIAISLLGLFGYAHGKAIIADRFWRVWFWIAIVEHAVWFGAAWVDDNARTILLDGSASLLVLAIFWGPLYIGLFRYAFMTPIPKENATPPDDGQDERVSSENQHRRSPGGILLEPEQDTE